MRFKNPSQRLRDIVENIGAIQAFAAGMTFEDFVLDRKTVYAVTRALEIISEASRRLPDELKSRHPGVDWPAVAAAGKSIGTSTKSSTMPWSGTPFNMNWPSCVSFPKLSLNG
jgi:uncharacterized protein with HEPN domain